MIKTHAIIYSSFLMGCNHSLLFLGLLAVMVSVILFFLLYFIDVDMSYIQRHWLQFVTASIVYSFLLSVYLYIRAQYKPQIELAPESTGKSYPFILIPLLQVPVFYCNMCSSVYLNACNSTDAALVYTGMRLLAFDFSKSGLQNRSMKLSFYVWLERATPTLLYVIVLYVL